MTKRYLVNAVVGTLAERPDASTPSGGASETPFGLYVDTDTGDIYESTGKNWVRVGTLAGNGATSISGLTGDGSDGITVAGAVTSSSSNGAGNNQLEIRNANLAVPLSARIDGLGEVFCTALFIVCTDEAGPETAFSVSQPSGWNLPVATFGVTGQPPRITLGREGGVGLFSHTPPTAPRTLAQSVITAITDANAKTAVQAVANALSDMGALTLT